MTLEEIKNKLTNIKGGTFTKVTYQTIQGDYKKVTTTKIRFVEYGHIQGVDVKHKPNPNESHIIPNKLIYNANTKNYYLQMAITTNTKPKVKYYYLGQEIDKTTYENANPKKPYQKPITSVFKKKIEDIIDIG